MAFDEIGDKLSSLFNNNEKKEKKNYLYTVITSQLRLSATIAVLLTIGWLVQGYFVYQETVERNAQSNRLNDLTSYDISYNKEETEKYQKDLTTIKDLLELDTTVTESLKEYETLQSNQNMYYKSFFHHLYFPSLNIWKNPFTEDIDITIMGEKYLNTDQFQDIPLIQYWSDFIKNMGNDFESNEITNIEIGDIEEISDEYFDIPITIEFTSPNKRSFLFLIDKLSTTSNKANISLLNEFFFYLIKNIQTQKKEEIKKLKEQYKEIFSNNVNDTTIIGYHLYQRIQNGEENILVDDNLINTTIKQNIFCDDKTSDNECFYYFREKYRNIPQLAYTIGMKDKKNKAKELKDFLQNLPPVISITNFNFNKNKKNNSIIDTTTNYEWTFRIKAYGRTISSTEIEEIAKELWEMCFKKDESLNISLAIEKVNQTLYQMRESITLTSDVLTNLEELVEILQRSEEEYKGLSNYKKAIKLFEVFRMLSDANICTM